MHGLINKAIEAFVKDTYVDDAWRAIGVRADLEDPSFEAMMVYDTPITTRIVVCATEVLNVDCADFLQNLGTYLVSQPTQQAVRRLLRRVSDLLCMSNSVHASSTKEHEDNDDYEGSIRRAA